VGCADYLDSIVVLKDGGIVERGSHKELLELDGLFASMWAQQVSASEEPLPSKVTVGYEVDETPVVDITESETRSNAPEEIVVESPQVVPASLHTKEVEVEVDTGVSLVFPVSDDTPGTDATSAPEPAPMAFPTTASTSKTPSVRSHPTGHVHSTSVTFDAGVLNTPPRTGTPEPGSTPGPGRKAAQNFQRLARRISLSGKGPKLANLPGLRRDASMVSTASASGAAGASTPASTSGRESTEEHQQQVDASPSKEEKKKKKRKSYI
jgi:hypothetical protein